MQYTILLISDNYAPYAKEVYNYLRDAGLNGKIDARSESLERKIRDAELKKTPYMLIIGKKETESNTVSVRQHGVGELGKMIIQQFIFRVLYPPTT